MWQTDYFARCDKCGNLELMDGRTKKVASRTAKSKGWSISATKILCPNCRKNKPCPDCGWADGKHFIDCPAIN